MSRKNQQLQTIDLVQVHPWIFGLISGQYATYYEIKYKLDIWDVLDLIEIMIIKASNTNLAMDNIDN